MPTPIPPTLAPIVAPAPAGSLTLLTSVLDATSEWLLLRYISAALLLLRAEKSDGNRRRRRARTNSFTASTEEEEEEEGEETSQSKTETEKELNIILISFVRPFELWREMGKKIGLDFPSLLRPTSSAHAAAAAARLTYIDAFSHVSFAASAPTPPFPSKPYKEIHTLPPFTTLAALENQVLALLPPGPPPLVNTGGKHLLVIDSPDLLLAMHSSSPANSPRTITASDLASLIITLRSRPTIHSTIVTLAADAPLLHPSSNSTQNHDHHLSNGNGDGLVTPLECNHRAFVTSLAHQAERVVQLRGLDTGVARDVGGVVRVSRGGAADWGDRKGETEGDIGGDVRREGGEGGGGRGEGKGGHGQQEQQHGQGEWLYQVKADGGARLWGRGEWEI